IRKEAEARPRYGERDRKREGRAERIGELEVVGGDRGPLDGGFGEDEQQGQRRCRKQRGGDRGDDRLSAHCSTGRGRPLSSTATKVNLASVTLISSSEWRSRRQASAEMVRLVRPMRTISQ